MILETLAATATVAAISIAFAPAWRRNAQPSRATLAPYVLLCPYCDGSIGRHMDWCEAYGAGHRRPTALPVDTRRVE